MFVERNLATNNDPIEEVDNVQIGDVVVDRVGFKDIETLKCKMTIIFCVSSSFII